MESLMEPTIEWTKLLSSFIGAIIGASAALSGIYMKARFDNKLSLKNWYEEKYITSVDGLMEFFSHLKLFYLDQLSQTGQVTEKPKVPINHMTNLASIIPDSSIDAIVMFFHAGPVDKTNKAAIQSFLESCKNINNRLDLLREALLDIEINQKSDVYLLKDNMSLNNHLKEIKSILSNLAN